MNPLCIYHGNCADGFAAAWCVRKFFDGKVDFHAGIYGQSPPDVIDRHVYIVDFSYKRDTLLKMAEQARKITVIDHHKTAMEDLTVGAMPGNVHVHFDMGHSGAMLTWKYFFNNADPPLLLHHIEDRDLWRFKLTGTREIQAALFSYPYDFDLWTQFMYTDCRDLRAEGVAIERKHFKDIKELLGISQRRMVIAGYDVPVANLPYIFSSDAGHQMAKDEPFAVCYFDTKEGRVFSLRSELGGMDVSEIAAKFGGGGHRHAAGFTIKPGWKLGWFDLELNP